MHIFVGSTNPVKINATKRAVAKVWPKATVEGIEVDSGVAVQPMSDEETRQGSSNRATLALKTGLSLLAKRQKKLSNSKTLVVKNAGTQLMKNSDDQFLGVGLEGGVCSLPDNLQTNLPNNSQELWSTVWASVVDLRGNLFQSNGARFKVPDTIAKRLLAGGEMGPTVSQLFKQENIKQTCGAIGLLSNGFIDRTEEYTTIVKLALGLWYGRDWPSKLAN